MNTNSYFIFFAILLLVGLLFFIPRCKGKKKEFVPHIETIRDLQQLFPATALEITNLVSSTLSQAKDKLQALAALPQEKYSFETVARELDTIASGISTTGAILCNIGFLSPEKEVRDAANQGSLKISEFSVDWLGQNVALYKTFKSYAENIAPHENLNAEERYFVEETLKDFKKAGLELPQEQRDKIKKLQKEIAALGLKFEENISTDNRTITVERKDLAGLDEDFIEALPKNEEGLYVLGVDYPTYFSVMKNVESGEVRKRLMHEFNNRAYPANEQVLKDLIKKRDELAKLLGYASYAHLNIDDAMAETPERVEQFLTDLISKADKKETQEFELFKKELPEGIFLTNDGKFNGWDLAYVLDKYKKKHFDIDEDKIAEYFPMDYTIKQLLDIYQQFFNLTLKEVPAPQLWNPEVKLIEVYKNSTPTRLGGERQAESKEFLGYLLLDLHPRSNKYSHACQIGTVSTLKDKNGKRTPGVVVVIANFPKATAKKPALLKYSDVNTFFHEFGHAIHSLLGATELASFSGTSVKRDFVEMPSQMLEEWLYDPEILKKVSKHYQTGQSLPDEIITKLIELKTFDSGSFVQRQANLATLALDVFKPGADKNVAELHKQLHEKLRKHVAFDDTSHFYTSFGHLPGYGAKYYGYLWSKVFALDLFEKIKKHGLLNPEIGAEYEAKVLGKGGSADPNDLLKDFLGRAPNQEAFLRDMGFE